MLKEEIAGMTTGYTVNAPQWVTTFTKAPEFKSFYKTVSGNEGNKCNYPTRLDLYGCGCFHDCSYCYAKSLLNSGDYGIQIIRPFPGRTKWRGRSAN